MQDVRTSYGLIVKTSDHRIVVIKRKVPYCVQEFYFHLYQRRRKVSHSTQFETQWLPKLSPQDRVDYLRFKHGYIFEDFYDFPHGQPSSKGGDDLYTCFYTAYREFCEETGFRFSFKRRDVRTYPRVKVEFVGCDRTPYIQHYFIVENVRGLRRFRYFDSFDIPLTCAAKIKSWNDDRLVYQGLLVSLDKAFKIFRHQQRIKKDDKHLLCSASTPYKREGLASR